MHALLSVSICISICSSSSFKNGIMLFEELCQRPDCIEGLSLQFQALQHLFLFSYIVILLGNIDLFILIFGDGSQGCVLLRWICLLCLLLNLLLLLLILLYHFLLIHFPVCRIVVLLIFFCVMHLVLIVPFFIIIVVFCFALLLFNFVLRIFI